MDEMMKSQLKQEHILRTELKLQFEHLRQELLVLYEEKNKRREAWILMHSVNIILTPSLYKTDLFYH